jgi:hypothetical protein
MVDVTSYSAIVPGNDPERSRDFAILATLGVACVGLIVVIWAYAVSVGVDPSILPPPGLQP